MATAPLTESCQLAPDALIAGRVRVAVLGVPALLTGAGGALLAEDPRLALVSVAAVLGWTRLVGL